MNKILILLSCVLIISVGQAQVARKYSNDFLSIGVGARGLAMSNAQVASVSDITAGYYNPAGLAHVNNNIQLGAMHAELFAGISKYDFVSFAVPFAEKTRTIGFTFIRYGVDNIPNTLNLYNPDGSIDYNNIRSFSVGSYGIYIHYAQKITAVKKGELSVGVSPKIIYNKMSTFANSVGFGIDVGVQYRYKNWKFGFMGRDLTSTFNAWKFNFTDEEKAVLVKTGNELPLNTLELTLPRLWFGVSYEYKLKKIMKLSPELSFDLSTDGKRNVILPGKPISLDMNFGLEISFVDIVYLRTGFGNVQKSTDDRGKKITTFQPNIGAGLGYKGYVRLDYAYTNIGESTGGLFSHVISLQLGINKKLKKAASTGPVK